MSFLCTCPVCGRVFRVDSRLDLTWFSPTAVISLHGCPDYPHRMTYEKWLRELDWVSWLVSKWFMNVPRPDWTYADL